MKYYYITWPFVLIYFRYKIAHIVARWMNINVCIIMQIYRYHLQWQYFGKRSLNMVTAKRPDNWTTDRQLNNIIQATSMFSIIK